jgi:hypothetical protein
MFHLAACRSTWPRSCTSRCAGTSVRQRQAATAKSEEGSSSEAQQAGGDLANGTADDANAMTRNDVTRRDRARPAPSFTVVAHPGQPSAWSRGALYGGGFGLAAAALALGFSILRPRPRRRPPEVPAPAQCNAWQRRN